MSWVGATTGEPSAGRQQVRRRQHHRPRLFLGSRRERHVDRHLVAVEVGVERRADERVDLDGRALDEDRHERLDAEAVEGRGAVQQDRVVLDDLLEHVPDLGPDALDDALRALDVVGEALSRRAGA
jgi:alkylhydroperoxidase family enzyme